MEVNVILTSRYERVVLMDCKEDTWLSLKSTVGNVMVPQVNSVQLKNDKIRLIFLLNKKIRNHFNCLVHFICISLLPLSRNKLLLLGQFCLKQFLLVAPSHFPPYF